MAKPPQDTATRQTKARAGDRPGKTPAAETVGRLHAQIRKVLGKHYANRYRTGRKGG